MRAPSASPPAPNVPAGGVYSPISAATWSGSGAYQVLGGTWNSTADQFTVSQTATGTAGTTITIDQSQQQRILITDPATGNSIGLGFLTTANPTIDSLAAAPLAGAGLTSLEAALPAGDAVLSGWQFSGGVAGYPVYLSLSLGGGSAHGDLAVWCYNGSAWAPTMPPT